MKDTTYSSRRSKQAHHDPPRQETMSSWLERQASNHQVQLAATAVLSGIAVAGIIYGSQAARRRVAIDELKASIPELSETHHAQTVCGRHRKTVCARAKLDDSLTVSVKLTNFGFAEPVGLANKDDERAAALARRAQQGDYDEGRSFDFLHFIYITEPKLN